MESKREGKRTGIYRSKLEQAWAMFFVECGIPFIHEPKYYGNWLPDFELTDCRVLIEVKPTVKIADEEVPEKREGMELAVNEKYDVVILIGQPRLGREGIGIDMSVPSPAGLAKLQVYQELYEKGEAPAILLNIYEFMDYTYSDWGCASVGWGGFVQCTECGAYFLIGEGIYVCRHCGFYEGDHGIKRPEFNKEVIDKYLDSEAWVDLWNCNWLARSNHRLDIDF